MPMKIKASLGFTKTLDPDLLSRVNVVADRLDGHMVFIKPPVDIAALKQAGDKLAGLIAETLDGGNRKTIAERKQQREVVISMLQQLGHYIEFACDGDMATFLSSGFEPASTTRTAAGPLPPAGIIRLEEGNSGEVLVYVKPLPRARSYEVRYAAIGAGGRPVPWAIATFTPAKPAATIGALTPGTAYVF